MSKVNSIEIDTIERPIEELMKDLSQVLVFLAKNGYYCTFYHDDCGVFVIEYDFKNPEIATHFFRWLSGDEYDKILMEEALKK